MSTATSTDIAVDIAVAITYSKHDPLAKACVQIHVEYLDLPRSKDL